MLTGKMYVTFDYVWIRENVLAIQRTTGLSCGLSVNNTENLKYLKIDVPSSNYDGDSLDLLRTNALEKHEFI